MKSLSRLSVRPALLSALVFVLATPAMADCTDDLALVIERMQGAGPFHSEITVNQNDIVTTTLRGDYALPDASHIWIDVDGQPTEVITIRDQGAWFRGSGAWEQYPATAREEYERYLRATFPTRMTDETLVCRPDSSPSFISFDAPWYAPDAWAEITVGPSGLPTRFAILTPDIVRVSTYEFDSNIAIEPPM